ncbi:ATP-cone domain-containing protein [Entamoeba marina]
MQNFPSITQVVKRDGRVEEFSIEKIVDGINKAFQETKPVPQYTPTKSVANAAARGALSVLREKKIENQLIINENCQTEIAKQYVLYRENRDKQRLSRSRLMQKYAEVSVMDSSELETKRENANINGNTSMALIFKFGSEGSVEYVRETATGELRNTIDAHVDGLIHVHDLDFLLMGTTTCCQIDFKKLFQHSFSTGHGSIRSPNDINSYTALTAIVLQSNQNDQHGGQSDPAFDYAMADGVNKTYLKVAADLLYELVFFNFGIELDIDALKTKIKGKVMLEKEWIDIPEIVVDLINNLKKQDDDLLETSQSGDPEQITVSVDDIKKLLPRVIKSVETKVLTQTKQAMQGIIHNLNTMHSRVGAQVPFTSLNFGTDTTPEGRMASKCLLNAVWEGLGNGETALFPITIFKVKEGINYNKEDPNFDLFQLAIKVSAKRLFPNFIFLDAPYNLQYYKKGDYRTEVATMGCRTRVMASVFPETDGIVTGKGNLSFTSVNIVRIAIESGGDIEKFFSRLHEVSQIVIKGLVERFKLQCQKSVKNFPFLLRQGIWSDAEKLKEGDSLFEVLKHGSLSMGFIGLAECLTSLTGKHHGESSEAQELGLRIVKCMRDICDQSCKEYTLNFALLATPAEGLRVDLLALIVVSMDLSKDFNITAADKIKLEAPYHALCNGGHISYVEMDGDPLKNLDAFEQVIRIMKESGIGYGSVNHPVDRDPFERLRRITGYLVGSLDRWNNAKRAEERDRYTYISRLKTVLEMLRDRGYITSDVDHETTLENFKERYGESDNTINRSHLTIKVVLGEDSSDGIIVFFAKDDKLKVETFTNYLGEVETQGCTKAIIVYHGQLSSVVKQSIERSKCQWEVMQEDELIVNVTKHVLVPKHILLSNEEKEALKKKYQVTVSQLPRLLKTDPICRYYGFQRGDVIKIVRKSETAGRYITYRAVF